MIKKILGIAFILALFGAAYYMGTRSTEIEYKITTVDLTETDTLNIIQDARLNWIPLDSAWTLAEINSIDKINWTEDTNWTFKDSLRIRDSVRVVYIPFFEAKDTIVHFDEIVDDIRVLASVMVKPRFFPYRSRFITDIQLQHIELTQPVQADSWWKHRWVVYAGWGFTYSFNNLNITDPDYFSHQGWFTGFQFGIGFRLY